MRLLDKYREVRNWHPPPGRTEVEIFTSEPKIFTQPSKPLPNQSSSRPFVSLIATVKNEETTIKPWLDSIFSQTRLPDEVIVVDGGSTDRTYQLLVDSVPRSPITIRVFREAGVNIAAGRNRAIQQAQGPVIACTDAGCVVPPYWLMNITGPFAADPSIEVVAGYYRAVEENDLERSMAVYFCPPADRIDVQSFLPSARSVAFLKCVWERVGGFPEWLTLTAEDTCFDLALKAQTRRWAFVPEAEVFWRLEPSLRCLFLQVRRYGRGSGEAGIHADQYISQCVGLLGRLAGAAVLASASIVAALELHDWLFVLTALLPVFWLGRTLYRNILIPKCASGLRWLKMSVLSAVVLCTIKLAMLVGYLEGMLSEKKRPQDAGALGEVVTSGD